MKPPCELIVTKVLPTIRATIVKILIEDYKMKQTEISKLLGISQSAVSQYYTSTRAVDRDLLKIFPEITKYSQDMARALVNGKIDGSNISLCEPCQMVRGNKEFCAYQEEFIQLKKCKICDEKEDE